MKKKGRVLTIVAGAIVALTLVIMITLQLVLNSPMVRRKVDQAAAGLIDGKLEYGRLHFDVFRSFPRLRVTLDTVSITYPHSRFARYDGHGPASPLLNVGRGASQDTLASFKHFTASVNLWRILGWKARLGDAELRGLRVAAHAYPGSAANWDIFKSSADDADTTKKGGFPLPGLSIGPVRMTDNPLLVFTSQKDTLYAGLFMREMLFRGNVKLRRKDRGFKFSGLTFSIDSLGLNGRTAADTIGVRMEHLLLKSPKRNTVDLNTSVKALFVSGKMGYLHVPFDLDTRIAYSKNKVMTQIEVPHLSLDAAYLPIRANGMAQILDDSTYVKAALSISDCSLGDVLRRYADGMIPSASDLSTNAHLDLSVDADGFLSPTQFPQVKATIKVPRSRVDYHPMDLRAHLELDAEGTMTPHKTLSAKFNKFAASTDGFDISLIGRGSDLLGKDPKVSAHVTGEADLGSLSRFLSDSLRLGGKLDMLVDADASLSEIKKLQFHNGLVSGHIVSEKVSLAMPYDSAYAGMDGTKLLLGSDSKGINADLLFDSLSFVKGSEMLAKIRDMKNHAGISRVVDKGTSVPKVAFSSDNSGVFFRSGANRVGARDLTLTAHLQKRGSREGARRKRHLDSLQRVYPGIPRDSLFRHDMKVNPRERPSYMKDSDFAKKDLHIDLSEDAVKFLKEWAPAAGISAAGGFYATPRLPLRNRLKKMDIQYNDDSFDLNALTVTSGTSDVSVKGRLTGLRRTLQGGGFLRGDLYIDSKRLNLNEFLTALEIGRESDYVAKSEEDESFVTDTLANVKYKPDSTMKVIVVPANLNASVNLHAGNVSFSDIEASPVDATLKVAKRCVQLTDTKFTTNLGNIEMNAFYASRNKQDIQLGADLQLMDMSAGSIIHMLPTVDKMMPALKSFEGNLSCRVSVTGQVDTMMNLIIPSLDGLVRIVGKDLEVKDAGKLRAITRLLLFKDKNIGHIDDLAVDALIENSHVEIYPFVLGVDRYKLALMGVQGLDRSMRYNVSIIKAPILPIPFGVNIFGSLDDFHFSIGRSKYRRGKVPVFTEEIDNIQINIGDAIRNVYEQGVQEAVDATMQSYENLRKRKEELGYTNALPKDFLSNNEYKQIEAAAFEEEMKSYNAQVEAEVDAALAESAKK